ncbi:hypothetical protein HQ587_10595 [bacterium]|nr:hypothetical protein [bacterium]
MKLKSIRASLSLLTLFLLLNSSLFSQVNVELEPRNITVGDPIEMTISLSPPEDATIILPGPEELAPVEIIRMDTLSTGKHELSVRYILSMFEPGEFKLVDIPILISQADGTDTLLINPGSFVVESILDPADSSSEIRDIHPPVKLAWTLQDLKWYIISAILLLVLLIAGYHYRRYLKIRRGEITLPAPPPVPSHVLALNRLEKLRIKRLWQNGYLKEYHSELNEIIKEYIGGRYEINALEMTTYDLLEERKKWAVEEELFKQVKRLLSTGDLVKFARYKTDPHENDKSLETAFSYVDTTKPLCCHSERSEESRLNPPGDEDSSLRSE